MLPCDAELKHLWRALICCMSSEFASVDPIGRGHLPSVMGVKTGPQRGETGSVCRCHWALLQLAPNLALVAVSLFMCLHAKCESSVKRNTYLPCACRVSDQGRVSGHSTPRLDERQARWRWEVCMYTTDNTPHILDSRIPAFLLVDQQTRRCLGGGSTLGDFLNRVGGGGHPPGTLVEPNQDLHRVVLHPQILDLFPYGCRKPILRRNKNMYIGPDNGNCGFKASQIVRSMGCWRDRAELQKCRVGLSAWQLRHHVLQPSPPESTLPR